MTTKILPNLKYTKDHDWISINGDIATFGITDFAQNALGDIVFVELPDVGASYSKGDTFGVVESVKSVTDLHVPVSGEVVEANNDLEGAPEKCNKAPYEAWIIKIKMTNPSETKDLLDAKKYQEFCDSAAH